MMSAVEAKEYFNEKDSYLIMRYDGNATNNAQMDRVFELSQWDTVVRLEPNVGNRYLLLNVLVELKRLMMSGRKFDRIFVGCYGSGYQRFFLPNLDKKEIFLLDDGTRTLDLQFDCLSVSNPYEFPEGLMNKVRKRVLQMAGFATKQRDMVHLFTCFDVESHPGQTVIKNDFSFLRGLAKGSFVPDDGTVYFLGGTYVEDAYLSADYYCRTIKEIAEYYKGKNFIYIAHRRESRENLAVLEGIEGVRILRFTYPAELEFILEKGEPAHVASFCSTALYTISVIFPDCDVSAFYLPPEEVNPVFRKRVQAFYDYYERYMKVVK